MNRRVLASALLGLASVALAASQTPQAPRVLEFSELERVRIARMSPLPPLAPDPTNAVADDPRAARLGQRLFFDKRFSRTGEIACASCHDPQRGYADGLARSRGVAEALRNAPTLLNVAHQRWFFWDGRADSLWAQALSPIENELEMAGNRTRLVRVVSEDASLRAEFEALFGPLPDFSDRARFPENAKPMVDLPELEMALAWGRMQEGDRELVDRAFSQVGKAFEAYERKLLGGTSAFDRFAAGLASGDAEQLAALGESEQRGLKLFIGKANCRTCHTGPLLSDGEFHDLGLAPLGGGDRRDAGRHAGAKQVLADPFNALSRFSDLGQCPDDPSASDAATKLRFLAQAGELWGQFRTPSLRNVALTAPYMHEGQLPDLAAVLRFYSAREGAAPPGHHQEKVLQPLNLTAEEQADLEAFLRSLTDAGLDPALLRPPEAHQRD
jgi:cytochrome c peroxidase